MRILGDWNHIFRIFCLFWTKKDRWIIMGSLRFNIPQPRNIIDLFGFLVTLTMISWLFHSHEESNFHHPRYHEQIFENFNRIPQRNFKNVANARRIYSGVQLNCLWSGFFFRILEDERENTTWNHFFLMSWLKNWNHSAINHQSLHNFKTKKS